LLPSYFRATSFLYQPKIVSGVAIFARRLAPTEQLPLPTKPTPLRGREAQTPLLLPEFSPLTNGAGRGALPATAGLSLGT